MSELGILTKDEQKQFGKKIDALVDWNKFGAGKKGVVKWAFKLIELKDDDLFSAMIKYLDDKYGEKIPINLKPTARKVALSVINDDYESFKMYSPMLLNDIFDIPSISEDTEAIIAKALVGGIVEALEAKFK